MSDSTANLFHPAVAAWLHGAFAQPTPAQLAAWPAIQSGKNVLIAAPTGSGKTLAAFLAAIDGLVREGVEHGALPDQTGVIYVSPLKALSNDIAINLEAPLAGIRVELERLGYRDVELRTAVRTGDTPQGDRARMVKRPPHILVTTPESLYVLLGSESGRLMLAGARSVIVDEIHAIAGSKRGSHLALSLERLDALCERRLVRIGLSATQKPIDEVARFLVGNVDPDCPEPNCTIIDVGYTRQRDLALEVPPVPLEAVMSNDVWALVYTRLATLIEEHRTTLVFVNTRRMAERVARHLSERLGKEVVAAHHGSLAKEHRLDAEQRLKRGDLRVLVATASLELGIDIGDVDLVCQLGSPHAISAFLQRVGRSGHAVIGTPKGRLFPQSRDDLVECAALLDCIRRGELDALVFPQAPIDVLAQQIVAEVACRDWSEDELFALVRGAYPYAQLARKDFDAVVRMLGDGFTTRRGTRGAYLHRDAVHKRLRGRRNARLTSLTSGGTIPDTADYLVVLEPQSQNIGTVHEDFAVESLAGDVFQLGNASYRILRVERDRIRVEDAHGAPPSIPFWLGEAPGRSDELSLGVSRLRADISERLENGLDAATAWLIDEVGLDAAAASQIVEYLARAKAALGMLPTQDTLAMERFFDESGGTQLIIHSPLGSHINKAWGLALRKRFCRKFNFELQAAATEDAIVLSLSTAHSFPLADVARYLHSETAEHVLVQALLDAPLFGVRWRWAATTALALPRFVGGSKVAPQLQRMKSEDLLATVFPDQVACAENLVGEREVPDHPLVAQTLHDCLHEAMDVDGWLRLLHGLESGEVKIVARDLTEPSPLAAEILTARPYAFLDDAPLEERRTQAVQSRRWSDPETADDLGQLDADAISGVREEAWPEARDADEMHEALMGLGFVTLGEAKANSRWSDWLDELAVASRAARVEIPISVESVGSERHSSKTIWCTAERVPQLQVLFPGAALDPTIDVPEEFAVIDWTREAALLELVRSRLSGLGPMTVDAIGASLPVAICDIEIALLGLESEGYVMRGQFTPGSRDEEWCERHLLARIHRYTIKRLRREIAPVEPRDFMRFLFDWQHVSPTTQVNGEQALAGIIAQLEGFQAPAAAWETEILPTRVADYSISWLDDLCRSGRIVWMRLKSHARTVVGERAASPVRATPVVVLPRRSQRIWTALAGDAADPALLSSRALAVFDHLAEHGASFFDEIAGATHLLNTELEDALGELVARGLINADSFAGLRALLVPAAKRATNHQRRSRRASLLGIEDAGRWALVRSPSAQPVAPLPASTRPASIRPSRTTSVPEHVEHVVRTLLRRYGVVCWRLLEREADWLPPWRDLLRVFHRLEARGEIRGGRFVAGLSGEQFALPDAVGALRSVRQRAGDGDLVCVSAADPLNQVGLIVAGVRVPAISGSRVLYRDGMPIATLIAGKIAWANAEPGVEMDEVPREYVDALYRRQQSIEATV
ncbi:MAG: DEAD/DEAH box helicase [Dokdonella sp.]